MSKEQSILELKHSVNLHVNLCNGPTAELAMFMIKVVDFLEDNDKDRVELEIKQLAYLIIESLGVFLQRHIDKKLQNVENPPQSLLDASSNILVVIGKQKHNKDFLANKGLVLAAMAESLRELSKFTNSQYPPITDCFQKPL